MLAQRSTQQALRRFALARPSLASQMVAKNFAAPLALTPSTQTRAAATTTNEKLLTPDAGNKILEAQRKLRPTAPHLLIYRPQITWYVSSLNRITGSLLSGGFYIFGSAYLIAPLVGWHLESASMAAAFAAWPVMLKVATKFLVALPFTFHCFAGVRHIVWDTASALSNSAVNKTGWTVVGASIVSALGLAFY